MSQNAKVWEVFYLFGNDFEAGQLRVEFCSKAFAFESGLLNAVSNDSN